MSLRFRLNLLITALSLAGMMIAGWVVIGQTRVEVATRVTGQLLDTVIISSHMRPELGYTHEVLRSFLESLGYVRGTSITLSDMRGNILYESPPSTYRSDVHPPQWFVKLVAPTPEVIHRRIRFGTLVVVSNPAGTIREAWNGFYQLMWIGMGFFILLNGMVYWVLGRALRPVGGILGGINRMEQGDLSVRLPKYDLPEFSRIGQNLNRMAESLETSTEENHRLALVVKQTGDAVVIHDLEGNISFWNPAAERLFGYRADEMLGRSAAVLTAPGREEELGQSLSAIRQRNVVEYLQTQRLARDGRVLDVSLSASPLIDPHSNARFASCATSPNACGRKRVSANWRKTAALPRLSRSTWKRSGAASRANCMTSWAST